MVDVPEIDWSAAALATVAYFFLGALWYSKALFGNAWMRATGKTEEELKQGSDPKTAMSGMFVVTLVSVIALATLIDHSATDDVAGALAIAVIVSFGFILPPLSANVFFEGRPWTLFMINFGYHTTGTIVAAIIYGLML